MTTFISSSLAPTGAARIESGTPTGYKLKKKKNGDYVLMGVFQWSEGFCGGFEWRELPTEIEEES